MWHQKQAKEEKKRHPSEKMQKENDTRVKKKGNPRIGFWRRDGFKTLAILKEERDGK